jgi:hypothetical protein
VAPQYTGSPAPRGGNKGGSAREGKGAEHFGGSPSAGLARFVLARGWGDQNPEVGGPCARASYGLAAGGVACARSTGQGSAPAPRVPVHERPGGALRGGALQGGAPLVRRCRTGQRPGRLGRGAGGWGLRGVSRLSALSVQPSIPDTTRVMVPGGRKRRDSASVEAQVPGLRRPEGSGAGKLAAGWASGHNRRRRPGEEPREQPRRAEPPVAGTGRCGRWLPREGGKGRGRLGASGAAPGDRAEVWPGIPALFVPVAAEGRCGCSQRES